MAHDKNGIPILPLKQKLDALAYCLREDAHGDAAGHLCDLLELCRQKIKPSVGKPFKDLKAMKVALLRQRADAH